MSSVMAKLDYKKLFRMVKMKANDKEPQEDLFPYQATLITWQMLSVGKCKIMYMKAKNPHFKYIAMRSEKRRLRRKDWSCSGHLDEN